MKLSQVPIRLVSDRVNSNGEFTRVYGGSWDSLAYDNVSTRAATGRLTETLLQDRYKTPEATGESLKPTNGELVRQYYQKSFSSKVELVRKVDTMYRRNAEVWQAYLQANSHNNILLPTAANYLCPKCGMTLGCRCHLFDKFGRKLER